MRYFEDYQIGEIERFGRYEVTRTEMRAFAERFDPQPFHLSDAGAADSPVFRAMAASGWHTTAMAMAMQVSAFGAEGPPYLAALGIDELRWLKPVYAGDVLTCERTVVGLEPSKGRPDAGRMRIRIVVRNGEGEAVMSQIGIVLVQRRPRAGGQAGEQENAN